MAIKVKKIDNICIKFKDSDNIMRRRGGLFVRNIYKDHYNVLFCDYDHPAYGEKADR